MSEFPKITPVDMALDSTVSKEASLGDIDATTTDCINGKIGTDTEMADTSLFDMLTSNRTALETSSLDAGDGSMADHSREGELLRFVADATVSTSIATSNGTFSYLDAGGKQVVVEYTPTANVCLQDVTLDLNAMTKSGVITFSYEVDGTNYRVIKEVTFTVTDPEKGIVVVFGGKVLRNGSKLKVEYTEDSDEGAARDIVYELGIVGAIAGA